MTDDADSMLDIARALEDIRMAELIEAGWSVSETEAIVDHDNGLHELFGAVPGCDRCEHESVYGR